MKECGLWAGEGVEVDGVDDGVEVDVDGVEVDDDVDDGV